MHNVTIIFEQIPERTDVYKVRATDDELAKLQLCHMQYINTETSPEAEAALDWLTNDFLAVREPMALESRHSKTWLPVVDESFLVVTGFMM